jgi:hypothetical protein
MTTLEQIQAYFGQEVDHQPVAEIRNVTRLALPPLFAHLGFCRGAEVGVWRGEFSELLCQANPALQLTCVDAWTPYPEYSSYRQPSKFAEAEADARERLPKYACTIIKGFSLDAARRIPKGSLDFVYLDAAHHFDAVMQDIIAWAPKVRSGGIVSGHDYFPEHRHWGFRVMEAVDAYRAAYDLQPLMLLGRRKRRASEIGERYRSWMWVNP